MPHFFRPPYPLPTVGLAAFLSIAMTGCAHDPNSVALTESDPQSFAAVSKQIPKIPETHFPGKEQTSTASSSPQCINDERSPAPAELDNPENFALPVKPGQCWVQTVIEPKPIKTPLAVVIRDAVNKIQVVPAQIVSQNKELVVKPSALSYRVEPPIYKKIQEKVLIQPEISRSVVVPAVYERKMSTITVQAEHTRIVRCNPQSPYYSAPLPSATRSLCAEVVPAVTRSVFRNILVQPETTRVDMQPAVYKTVTKWVLDQPAKVIPIEKAPITKNITVKDIANPEHIEEQQIPPKVQQLMSTNYEGEPKLVFRRAVCDDNMTPQLIKSLQTSLTDKGFNLGSIDGKFGLNTQKALLAYQREQGLAYGALTYETLQALHIEIE